MKKNIFLNKLKGFMGDDYDRFTACYENPAFRGIRVNTLKCSSSVLLKHFKGLKKSPFCPEGYYINDNLSGVGNSPLHHAGAFYVQEPSAASAVTVLDVKPGDKVLDLCAAPGGKSTQIAAGLRGEGVLVANEYVLQRAKILSSNIERMGVRNAVVTSNRPDEICLRLGSVFDKVLVDAPCSGEGMFRKHPQAAEMWSEQVVADCAKRQALILESAKNAVAKGGELVYSTCTFSPEENELQIDAFLTRNPEFELVDCGVDFGSALPNGRLKNITADTEKMRRVFPFDGGEGHFVAKLRKTADTGGGFRRDYKYAPQDDKLFCEFLHSNFNSSFSERILIKRDEIYILPKSLPDVSGLRVIRAGIMAGKLCKNRFEPAHGLYMACMPGEVKNRIELQADDKAAADFLHGFEISCDKALKGYVGVFISGVAAGFGKASNGKLKNHYPKGLRIIK